ncbi:MAG: murein biosynthesis integral membrane protein MurJ [Caldilineae bacterium]|nr:MAG: murein biosynthesis integral membrane protein MurJ [Caldilineae bacterium]
MTTRSQHLVRSSLLVIFIYGLNKVTGLGKLLLMTRLFGAGPEADAFTAANQLPELLLAMLAGGALSAALIPVYSRRLLHQQMDQAHALSGAVLGLTVTLVGLACGAAWFATPWLVRTVLTPDFPPAQQALTGELMRVLLASTLLIAVGGVFSSLLHAHQHFFAPALATVVIDVGQILGFLFLVPRWGIHGAAWGSVLGAALLVAVQAPPLLRRGVPLRPRHRPDRRDMQELGRLFWPRVITMGAYQAVDLVFIRLASQLPAGSIAAYFYAMLAMVAMPKSLFGNAISTVIFPTAAEQFNTGESTALNRTVARGLQATWMLVIPSAVGLVSLGRPAAAFLFERGAFGPDSTDLVFLLMTILSVRLVADASQDVLSLTFFARHNTRVVMWANLAWMALNIGLSVLLVGPFGIAGLAWAASLAAAGLALLLAGLHWWMGVPLNVGELSRSLGRTLLASGGMSLLILALRRLALPTLLYLTLGVTGGGLFFAVLFSALGGQEIGQAWRLLGFLKRDQV